TTIWSGRISYRSARTTFTLTNTTVSACWACSRAPAPPASRRSAAPSAPHDQPATTRLGERGNNQPITASTPAPHLHVRLVDPQDLCAAVRPVRIGVRRRLASRPAQ